MKKIITDYLLKRFFKNVKILKNKKGFSLIEIMVGLGLLVIIGGIATTQYANYTTRAKTGAVNATLRSIERAVGVCVVDGQVALTECMKPHVNNTIIGKKGFGIGIKTAAPNTCFYVVEDATGTTGYTVPTAIPVGKIFGRSAFVTATGRKVTPSIDHAADTAAGTETTGCASGEH